MPIRVKGSKLTVAISDPRDIRVLDGLRLALQQRYAIDPVLATEEDILKELRVARAGRTAFVVAHRLTAVRDADHILVFAEDGRIAEQGTHTELLRSRGFYAQAWAQQQLEAEIEAEDVA